MPCEQVHCHDAGSVSFCKKFGPFPSNFSTQPFQYFQVVNLVDCLSSWYKFIMNNSSNIKKSQQNFLLLIWTDGNFWSWGICSLPLCTLRLRFRVVLVDPCIISFDDMAQNVILPLQNALAHCDSSLLLFSVSSFGTIFAHTFLMSRSSVKIFLTVLSVDVDPLCCAPDSQPNVFTYNLTNFCIVFFSSACCWPS